jgi:cytochrome c-type biogenesis protein CcmH
VSASLTAIERQVMCVTCKIPLNVAESPQADRERQFIRGLIAKGRSEGQIKSALVAQYGPSALALPRAQGFDATVYIVPLVLAVVLVATLSVLLVNWRRRTRRDDDRADPIPSLSAADSQRLDADMKRFD